jgi:nucleotide-binding universal stress UspA family protein
VFASVIVALSAQADGRDAIVLGAQLAGADGSLVVGEVLVTSPAPLAALSEAAAQRRRRPQDAAAEVYATLGPDPRARYVPLSGLPFADAVAALSRRVKPDVIVVGQSLLGREPGVDQLLREAPCPVAVAPYGHRFVRDFRPADLLEVPGADDELLRNASCPVLVGGRIRSRNHVVRGGA